MSAPTPGGYGAGGTNQYIRLQAAMQLDADAALKSASWGLGQVMGVNFSTAGFPDVNTMVAAMVASEDAQLKAMATFIQENGIGQYLKNHNWAGFARLYNGPNYAANNYDGLLQQFYSRFVTGAVPNLTVRAAQVYLTFRNFAPGIIDGENGPKTVAAVEAFQTSIGVPVTGVIDALLLQQLSK